MAAVVFERVSKVFDDGTEALVDFDLEVADGELVVLVGPSGCGKSTVLRLLAGLETATSGEIRIGGRPVHDLAPRARDVAMVFQNYALYPHMSVRQNLAFPLRMMKRPRGEIEERVRLTASMLGLEALLDRKPAALSGGQRQRVAMGRALVREPDVFLMDEPLSNLDAKLRVQMRAEITTLQRRLRTTTLYVTHDQVEAMTVGHRLAVLRDGRLQQVGPPQALYDRPANLFVATFIGSPSMNLFASSIEAAGGRPRLRVGSSWLPLPANGFPLEPRGVIAGLRPEAFVPADSVPAELRIEVDVRTVEVVGHEQLVHFDAGAEPAPAEVLAAGGFARARSLPGGADAIDAPAVAWVARLAPDVALAAGTRQQLGVDVRRLYLFGHDGKRLAP